MAQSTPQRATYLYGLDAVRLAAALSVALFHLTWEQPSIADTAWFGWVGVQIFFVISGLVIANSSHGTTPLKFLRSRLLRLYPTAWICAAISFVVLSFSYHVALRSLLGSVTLSPVGPFLATAYWTLPIELSFYLVVLMLIRAGRAEQLHQLASFLSIYSSLYLAAYGLHCFSIINTPWLELGYGWKNISLLRHGIYFALGIFMWRWSIGLFTRSNALFSLTCILAAAIEISCRTLEVTEKVQRFPAVHLFRFAPLIAALVGLAALGISIRLRTRIAAMAPWKLKALRVGGLITYPLYLLHETIGLSASSQLMARGMSAGASVCVALLAAALAAWFVADKIDPVVGRVLRASLKPALPATT